jgi:hypothetical protein
MSYQRSPDALHAEVNGSLIIMNVENTLFDGDDKLFKSILKNTIIYGEYGSGKSTVWVLNNTNAIICTVDFDQRWIDHVKYGVADNNRLTAKWVNAGDIGDWGTPLSYSHRHNFKTYTDFMWQQKNKPSVVLIDGRFRVCCFLTTLKHAEQGTKILFDDYAERKRYHIVEEFVHPTETCGRQYLFVVPPKNCIDQLLINEYIEKFRFVIE